jgi:hypothetical protein
MFANRIGGMMQKRKPAGWRGARPEPPREPVYPIPHYTRPDPINDPKGSLLERLMFDEDIENFMQKRRKRMIRPKV